MACRILEYLHSVCIHPSFGALVLKMPILLSPHPTPLQQSNLHQNPCVTRAAIPKHRNMGTPHTPKFSLMRLPPELVHHIIKEVILADNEEKGWRTSFSLSQTSRALQRDVYCSLRRNAVSMSQADRVPWSVITFMKRVHDYRPALADFICEEFDAQDAWRRCGISVPCHITKPSAARSPRM